MQKGHLIISGDLNCHFGYEEEEILESPLFGNILLHPRSNTNGDEVFMLCELHKLKVPTTIYHRSTKVTWTNSHRSSQIDHVLLPADGKIILNGPKGTWSKISTDHKLLSWSIKIPSDVRHVSTNNLPAYSTYYSKSWELSALRSEKVAESFDTLIDQQIKQRPSNIQWAEVCSIVCYCSTKILKKNSKNITEEQQQAYKNYRFLLSQVMQRRIVDKQPDLVDPTFDYPPSVPVGAIRLLRDAHKILLKAKNNKSRLALTEFLNETEINAPIAGQRVNLAFQYLKTSRRSSAQFCSSSLSMKDWYEDLLKQQGEFLSLLPEDLSEPVQPPTFIEMMTVIKSMKNGKTPGMDNICVEMLKSSPTLCYTLYQFIKRAFSKNEIPTEWQQTFTVPIPKKKGTKTIDDYRKLTMCSNAYKIYSALLMTRLDDYLPPVDYYQSGFLKNRSCDDLNFILRNLLDYRWNHGKSTCVISLDLCKAFDTVNISLVPDILSTHHVPPFLINRVITAILTEYNCVKWNGQFTHSVLKGKGIKQGCKGSPKIFVYILNEAIMKTKMKLALKGINLCTGNVEERLTLPLILSYADDCYIVCEDIHQGILISEEFCEQLRFYGLEFNYAKSKILFKSQEPIIQTGYDICGNHVAVVPAINVLGTPISTNMDRKRTIKPRVTTAIKLFRALLPYLKNLKAPMDLLVRLYICIIVPCLIYGLTCSSMTKSNAMTLMRREIYILRELANIAHPRPPQSTLAALLNFKTINRKVSVGRIRYYYHVKRSHRNSLILQSLSYSENARRKVGRPLYTFSDTLKKDIKKYLRLGITQSELDEDYELRNVIKGLTAQLYSQQDLLDDPLPDDLYLYDEGEVDPS